MFLSFYGLEFNPFDKDINSKHAYLTNDLKIMNNRLDFLKEHPSIAYLRVMLVLVKPSLLGPF